MADVHGEGEVVDLGPDDRGSILGELVHRQRLALGMTVVTAAESAPMSRDRWTRFEGGDFANVRPLSLSRLEGVLGWRPGSIGEYLAGGERLPAGVDDLVRERLAQPDAEGDVDQRAVLALVKRELSADESRRMRRELLRLLAETEG